MFKKVNYLDIYWMRLKKYNRSRNDDKSTNLELTYVGIGTLKLVLVVVTSLLIFEGFSRYLVSGVFASIMD